jgi:hypothetical protein
MPSPPRPLANRGTRHGVPCGFGARLRLRAAVSDAPRPGDALASASAARRAINAWVSSARQTVMPGPSLRGFGALPALTHAHHVVVPTGMGPGIPQYLRLPYEARLGKRVNTTHLDHWFHRSSGYVRTAARCRGPVARASRNRNGDEPVLLLAFFGVGACESKWAARIPQPPAGTSPPPNRHRAEGGFRLRRLRAAKTG